MTGAHRSRPTRRKLPIGIQSFRKLREGGHYYVDKTPLVERLVRDGAAYFLSRPRRFGKSLLLDTVRELFLGSEELFRGLAIHDRWDWSERHPVVRISFAGDFTDPQEVAGRSLDQLNAIAGEQQVVLSANTIGGRFAELLAALHRASGRRVVVLVDEYDKPILDVLDRPDVARANRDFLRGLYTVIKDSDAHVRFTLLTGVSRFSKVNLFSGLNNLEDITLDSRFSTICGYTQRDMDEVFAPELEGLDAGKVREWYNGYRWLGEAVYNPFDALLLMRTRKFRPHWFETGSPTFLIDLLARRGVDTFDLDRLEADEVLLSAFDVERIGTEALLWQTGYLTIQGVDDEDGEDVFQLGYPNLEVRRSLNRHLFARLARGGGIMGPADWRPALRALRSGDPGGLEAELRAHFAAIPHQWHTRNDIARYEGYYASVFYSFLAGIGLDVRAEESSAAGRLDVAVVLEEAVWLFEFKMDERATPGAALEQLLAKGYAEKHRRAGRAVRLVGIHFSEETRTITAFETAEG